MLNVFFLYHRGFLEGASSRFNKTRSPTNALVKEKAVFWVLEKEIPAPHVDTLDVWMWACPLEVGFKTFSLSPSKFHFFMKSIPKLSTNCRGQTDDHVL